MPTNYVDGGPQIQNDQTWTQSGQFKIGRSYSSAAEIVARSYIQVNSAGTSAGTAVHYQQLLYTLYVALTATCSWVPVVST